MRWRMRWCGPVVSECVRWTSNVRVALEEEVLITTNKVVLRSEDSVSDNAWRTLKLAKSKPPVTELVMTM